MSLAILVSFLAPFSEPLQSQHVGQGARLDSQTGPSTCAVSMFSRLLRLLGPSCRLFLAIEALWPELALTPSCSQSAAPQHLSSGQL